MSRYESASSPAENHLHTMKTFVSDYSSKVISMEETMADRVSLVWDSTNDPIGLLTEPFEAKKVQDLFSSDNKPFDKVMTVCSYLCWEIQQLQAVAANKFYAPLSLFGVSIGDVSPREIEEPMGEEGEMELQCGRLFTKLQDLHNFVERCREVGKNLMQQLANLYKDDRVRGQTTSFAGVHIATIFEHIGELCSIFMSLDAVIDGNENIRECFRAYKLMLKTVAQDPARFGSDDATQDRFEDYINTLEDELLDNRIFSLFTDQEFTRPGEVNMTANRAFMSEFHQNIAQTAQQIATTGFAERLRMGRKILKQGRELIGLYGIYILYCRMSRVQPDKKLYKELYGLHRQLPGVYVYGKVVLFPVDLLASMVPPPPQSVKLLDLTAERKAYVQLVDKDLQSIAEAAYLRGCNWLINLEESLAQMVSGVDLYKSSLATGDMLHEGVLMAQGNGFLLRTFMTLHSSLQLGYRRDDLRAISKLIELQHTLGRSFSRRHSQIALRLTLVVRHFTRYLSDMLAPVRQKLEKALATASGSMRSKKAEGSMVDMLSAVRLMMNLLDGCVGAERLLVLNLTWELFAPRGSQYCSREVLKAFDTNLSKLGVLVRIRTLMAEACDLSFVFHQLELFPEFIKQIYADPAQATRLPNVIASLEDAGLMLKYTCHDADEERSLLTAFKKEVMEFLNEGVIQPLCTETDTDLRMHIHSSLIVQELQQANPMQDGVKDLSRFFNLPSIRFCGQSVSIQDRVVHYLNSNFYNQTTVALHNWMTYSEMRNLAREKFGLQLNDGFLPGQTLQQGLDVLEVMRNIHIFTARYHYNLNAQFFVENDTETRHLNSITIQHIANSIRTHGLGMMNTTINFIYQFLVQKFMTFSQFLFDDNIKSRLIKDVRYFTKEKKSLDNKYPYTRSEHFIKSIKRLGQHEGTDFLNQFRKLITEIGNALGYVRIIRSGGLRYCSNATAFIPELSQEPKFEANASEAGLPPETVASAKILDDVVKNLQQQSAEGSDYFDIMVEAFSELSDAKKNEHLRNFYVIIPPLMLRYVDHMLLERDRMGKKGKFGCFTDDGFAIGLAYILSVLKLNPLFDSLHWFDSLTDEFREQERLLAQSQSSAGKSDDQAQFALRKRKLRNRKAEFDLLYFAFNGARIFFRGKDAVGVSAT